MRKCDVCGKNKAVYEVYGTNKKICNSCTGNFFICPECGTIYEQDDYENGDTDGVCRRKCANKE
jgi:hypothetical protein